MSEFSDRIKLWVDKAAPHTDRVRQFFSNRMMRFEATLSSLVARYRIGEQWICETDGSDAGRKQPRLLTLLLIGLLIFLIFEFSATMPWWPYFVLSLVVVPLLYLFLDPLVRGRRTRQLLRYTFWAVTITFGLSTGVALWFGHFRDATKTWRQADGPVFPHVGQLFAFLVFCVAYIFSRVIAGLILGNARKEFEPLGLPELLQRSDLHEKTKNEANAERHSRWYTVLSPLSRPLELLFPASLWLVCADGSWLPFMTKTWFSMLYVGVAVFLFGASWLVLMWEDYRPEWQPVREGFDRALLKGGLWTTTIVVILLAFAWITDFDQVTTVMEGDRPFLNWLIIAAYTLFWTYEYWVNRVLTSHLVPLLAPRDPECNLSETEGVRRLRNAPVRETLDFKTSATNDEHDCRVTIFGASRFAVHRDDGTSPAIFERTHLFASLVETIPDPALKAKGMMLVSDLRVQIRNYFLSLNIMLLVQFMGFVSTVVFAERYPVVTIQHYSTGELDAQLKSSRDWLLNSSPEKPSLTTMAGGASQRPRVILIAASGGGTRAALFTSSVLQGLQSRGRLGDVKIVSGVSGGGVALAYFASHHKELIEADPDQKLLPRDPGRKSGGRLALGQLPCRHVEAIYCRCLARHAGAADCMERLVGDAPGGKP
jgi:hypothetical protein